MAKTIIALLMITILFLAVLLVLIVGLGLALLIFSRTGAKRQGILAEKRPS